MEDYTKIMALEQGKRSRKACIRGLRITVSDVLSYLDSGMSEQETLDDFPELTKEDKLACLAYAAEMEQKTKVALQVNKQKVQIPSTPCI